MENKSIHKKLAENLREEAAQLLGSIAQCVNHNAITETEAKRLRSLIFEFYNLSYNLKHKK